MAGEATRFKPGVSGNPAGRAPKKSLKSLLEEVGRKTVLLGDKIPHGVTAEEYFLESLYDHAISGKAAYAQLICDHRWGPAKPSEDMTSDDVRNALANLALERVIADQARRAAEGEPKLDGDASCP